MLKEGGGRRCQGPQMAFGKSKFELDSYEGPSCFISNNICHLELAFLTNKIDILE